MFRTILLGTALLGAAGATTIAFAHITLENQQAAVGASYKAVLRVPHGCDGSATVAVPGDGRYEWAGYLPMRDLPHIVDPSQTRPCTDCVGRTVAPSSKTVLR